MKAGLHKQNINFARIFLLVCALGARFSDDKRVALPGENGVPWSSAGWVYFSQVMTINSEHVRYSVLLGSDALFLEPVLASAGLSDLQAMALTALYLTGTSAPHTAWIFIGLGLRCAQDIGAHREQVRFLLLQGRFARSLL